MMAGAGDPVIAAERGDRRFHASEWRENTALNLLKQSYLLNSRVIRDLVEASDLDAAAKTAARAGGPTAALSSGRQQVTRRARRSPQPGPAPARVSFESRWGHDRAKVQVRSLFGTSQTPDRQGSSRALEGHILTTWPPGWRYFRLWNGHRVHVAGAVDGLENRPTPVRKPGLILWGHLPGCDASVRDLDPPRWGLARRRGSRGQKRQPIPRGRRCPR